MIKIYHNPRCGKSREGLAILEKSQQKFEIVKYLETPPTRVELENLIKQLGNTPIELVRVKEEIWIKKFKNIELCEAQIIEAMIQFPILIERPIISDGKNAVLGRPPEKIHVFLNNI